ncbi:cellulose biosynthesis cyclic di-GMP-binding regulatory protein BcsB [Mucilaginibacter ginsenosidivorax]|uniref:Cellulose biosynthesis cyclic di-GMP-binding regulatory protein BcsB n=1 Tax=Mucilaginibacter ginsenosidivorax TaxID=862126 RepID=A0A5B8VWK6_9SPHI|nr:cellulose biosynthesis cyclic di-GMP-binding regulatory protein BcsB [Mucilaginibacter ginsenosidivorax]QEC75839.1 cellulose biosynthesis cyclic di-GMP-binding regulatory protein BcsB [Mucilaginibacter ginsenosidivorax]
MNKFLSLLAFVFLISTASKAQHLVTFKTLGHDDDMIYGMSGANSFYFKITPLTEMNGSKVVLFFEPSQALLKEHSYINVVINNKPAYSGRMTKDSIQKVTLNLTRADLSNDKFLKIQIKTLLTITDDECRDLDNPGMWLKVKNYSYLSLLRNTKGFFDNVNISNCFDSKKAIVYPVNPTLPDLKAVAWAYSRLKKTQTRDIMVYDEAHVPDTLRNYIKVGTIGSLGADSRELLKVTPQNGQGLFYLHKSMSMVTDTNTRLVDVKGVLTAVKTATQELQPKEVLFVTGGDNAGYEKAITALGNMNILNSTYGDYLLIEKAQNTFSKTIDENRSKLSLKQIGGVADFLSGIGSLKSAYSFKNSDFSFTPKEVEIRFVANYSALSAGDRGFFNIYLNGLLINSEKLDGTGKLNTAITINRYQHHKYNTLEAEFRFYPTSGHCKDSFTNFFAEVDVDKSYLESKNPFVTSDLSFYQYPEAFNTGTTRIVVSKDYAKYAAGALGEIIYELNNNINANNFPEFVYSEEIPPGDLKKYNIIALLSKNDKLMGEFPDAPIRFDKDFRLYKTDDNTVVYSLNDTVSNGLAQIFYGRSNNATLVLTATGTHVSEAFLAASKSITEQLSTLSSNVCISDVNSNKYLFNINKSSENLEYIDTKSGLTRFWDSYNLYILLGILILILLSFLYVRSRVQRSQDLFND